MQCCETGGVDTEEAGSSPTHHIDPHIFFKAIAGQLDKTEGITVLYGADSALSLHDEGFYATAWVKKPLHISFP
jgi:hypothetical protein